MKVSIFDWNGNLLTEVKEDEKKFGITIEPIEGTLCMGFTTFEVTGTEGSIFEFLDYYDLEEDE